MLKIPLIADLLKGSLNVGLADDAVDRLSYFCSTSLLVFFALIIGGNQYFGAPMQCMAPKQYPDSWKLYVRDVCFVNGTYSLPNDRRLPEHLLDPTARDILHINYYQAVLFYAPQAFWQWTQSLGALELTPLVEESMKCRGMTADREQHESRLVSLLITRLPAGTRITVLFLVVKMWYVVNVIGQWIALNRFLGPQYTFWGIEILMDLWKGKECFESPIFPRSTRCQYTTQTLGQYQLHEVQCVLMLNMLNEKIFLLVWWWLLLVGMAATCSLLWRVQRVARPADEFYDLLPPDSPHDTKEAVLRYHLRHHLGRDGLLLFTFVRSHAGAIVARNLLARIAKEYRRRVEQHALRQVTSDHSKKRFVTAATLDVICSTSKQL